MKYDFAYITIMKIKIIKTFWIHAYEQKIQVNIGSYKF